MQDVFFTSDYEVVPVTINLKMARCLLVLNLLLIATVLAKPQCGGRNLKKKSESNADEQGEYEGGDMILTPEQMGITSKAGIKGTNYRWPKGVIPYVIDKTFTAKERKVVMDAIYEVQNKTCIRLKKRVSQTDYITIVRGAASSGCYSNVGRTGGNQKVNIQPGNPGCVTKGIIAHELVHAIGFYHEQSRSDRDQYVTINYQNIKTSSVHNFNKYDTTKVDPFGVSYDYGSLMHYSATAFSANGNATITPKTTAGRNIGQRTGLSAKDAQKINNMYKNCTL